MLPASLECLHFGEGFDQPLEHVWPDTAGFAGDVTGTDGLSGTQDASHLGLSED